MKAIIHDIGAAFRRPTVIIASALIIFLSAWMIDTFGYLIWRRFPIPILVIATACVWIAIARSINQPQLSRIVRAMAVGLCGFGVSVTAGAFLDSFLFTSTGYFSFVANVCLWCWVAFESYRGLKILMSMTPPDKQKVTESTAVIIAQMTATEKRIEQVVADSTSVLDKTRFKYS